MAIPDRLAFKKPSNDELRELRKLYDEIERRVSSKEDASELLSSWNARANRHSSAEDFTTFHGAIDADDFVREALLPRPMFVHDLTYEELKAVVQCVKDASLDSESALSFFRGWLEVQLPGAEVSDLIYWPDRWFGLPGAARLDLSAEQITTAAMQRSGRVLPGSPGIKLPFSVPPKRVTLITPPPKE